MFLWIKIWMTKWELDSAPSPCRWERGYHNHSVVCLSVRRVRVRVRVTITIILTHLVVLFNNLCLYIKYCRSFTVVVNVKSIEKLWTHPCVLSCVPCHVCLIIWMNEAWSINGWHSLINENFITYADLLNILHYTVIRIHLFDIQMF